MKKITLTLLGLFSSLFALDATDIEAKIQEIQKLPPQERVEKMNALKMEIRALNENEREKVIEALAKTHEIKTEKNQEMQTHMTQTKTKIGTHKAEMEHNMLGQEHNMPEVEHNTPEIEHEVPEIEHNMPEIEHETPEVEHDTTEMEHNTDKIEIER